MTDILDVPLRARPAPELAIAVPSDALLPLQWHLRNTGQTGGTAGVDLNVTSVWADYTGQGVRIGIIDDGFDLDHAELRTAFDTDLDYDFRAEDDDPSAEPGDIHGTAVSGILAAAVNDSGIVGIAPEAHLVGLRVSFAADSTPAMFERALAELVHVDIANNSWAYRTAFVDNFAMPYMQLMRAAIDDAVTHGRNGLGTNIVFAAANWRDSGDNTNLHSLRNASAIITVAGLDAEGKVLSYSTPGATLLVSAPGQAILTTDRTGAAGYDPSDYISLSGTSFAAPMVSGVIALMLDANPALGYRDVQEILAYSARKLDGSISRWQTNGAQTLNGSGLHFSHDYGFGLVDAHAAVRLAESWRAIPATAASLTRLSATATLSSDIPDGSSAAVSTIDMPTALRIDRVDITLDIDHARASDLRVVLISPAGTESLLLDHPNVGTLPAFTYGSVATWGESSLGTWTLKITDARAGETGRLEGWSITFLGDPITDDDTYIFTDEYGATATTSLIDDTNGGHDALNAAAVSGQVILDLGGRFGWLGGQPIAIASGTSIETLMTGDAADILTGDGLQNHISAGRGDDMIFASGGDDVIDGGAGLDTFIFTGRFAETILAHTSDSVTLRHQDTGDILHLDNIEQFTIALTTLPFAELLAVADIVDGVFKDGGTGRDLLRGSLDGDALFGGDGDDYLSGFERADYIQGGAGIDRLYGGPGDDLLHGGGGNDVLWVGSDADRLDGGLGDDTLFGEDGADHLTGGAGADRLYGGDGGDRLTGGPGQDSLYGGTGRYTFVLTQLDGIVDFIFDFETTGPDADHLDLRLLLSGFRASDPIADFVSLAVFGTDTLVCVNADGIGTDFVPAARLAHATLTEPLQDYLDRNVLIALDTQLS